MEELPLIPSCTQFLPAWPGLRVVHAANYQFAKDGAEFFNCDLKFHQGLVQNGCFVYPFSVNDRARMLSPIRSKTFGMGRANRALIRTCLEVHPDLLLLGHAQHIHRRTLAEIRRLLPDVKIGLWYVDPVWPGSPIEHIGERIDLLDALFITTGGERLQSFARPHCPAAFIPNPVEPSVERGRAFECDRPEFDLVFFGRDKNAPQRRQYLTELAATLHDLRVGIFGSLGQPEVYGAEKERILCRSRMALNLSRRNDLELYSSDRLGQIVGNGVLAVTPAGCGLEQLFADDEALYFNDVDDAGQRIRAMAGDDQTARWLARRGWERAHRDYSAANITRFILDLTFRHDRALQVPWHRHIYGWPAAAPADGRAHPRAA